jgi:hypothetical protein
VDTSRNRTDFSHRKDLFCFYLSNAAKAFVNLCQNDLRKSVRVWERRGASFMLRSKEVKNMQVRILQKLSYIKHTQHTRMHTHTHTHTSTLTHTSSWGGKTSRHWKTFVHSVQCKHTYTHAEGRFSYAPMHKVDQTDMCELANSHTRADTHTIRTNTHNCTQTYTHLDGSDDMSIQAGLIAQIQEHICKHTLRTDSQSCTRSWIEPTTHSQTHTRTHMCTYI